MEKLLKHNISIYQKYEKIFVVSNVCTIFENTEIKKRDAKNKKLILN